MTVESSNHGPNQKEENNQQVPLFFSLTQAHNAFDKKDT